MLKSGLVVVDEGGRRERAVDEGDGVPIFHNVENIRGSFQDVPPEGEVTRMGYTTGDVVVSELQKPVAGQHRWGFEHAGRFRVLP